MAYVRLPQEIKNWWIAWFWEEHFRWNLETGCLEWTKCVGRGGYGKIGWMHTTYPAHRMAYYLYYEVDPGDLMVRHLCNNVICCNPRHLALGTAQDNADDRERAGHTFRGEQHWMKKRPDHFAELKAKGSYDARTIRHLAGPDHANTKLTAEAVRELRDRRKECNGDRKLLGLLNKEFAARFDLTESAIAHAGTGRNWKHVE